jgi:hypothetical protein
VVQRNALGQASAQPNTEEAEHKTHNYALAQLSKLGTSVAVKFAKAGDGQVHHEGRHKTSQKAQACYAQRCSQSRRDLHVPNTLPRRRRFRMHRQQHPCQPYLLPPARQFQHDVPVGLARTLAHQRLGPLQDLHVR